MQSAGLHLKLHSAIAYFRYAAVMETLLNESFVYLMNTVQRENPPDLPGEMPHTVTYSQVLELFGMHLTYSTH